jgi:hypothetical protein
MCKKLIYPAFFAAALSLIVTSMAQAELVGWWKFDEGSGTAAHDSSGNGNNGVIHGAQTTAGKIGAALAFDEIDDYVVVPDFAYGPEFTVAFWFKCSDLDGTAFQYMFSHAPYDTGNSLNIYFGENDEGEPNGGGYLRTALRDANDAAEETNRLDVAPGLADGEWHHYALTASSGIGATVYVDGISQASSSQGGDAFDPSTDLYFGGRVDLNAERFFGGELDDVRIFNHVLLEAEILGIMASGPYAFGPDPADGELLTNTWVNLSWILGLSAVSHDVYLGDDFDAVNEATRDSDVFRGNLADTFYLAGLPGYAYPEGLVPGSTYYWRIDEVNETDPESPWKGPVWSFSIAPKTAYNPVPPDGDAVSGTKPTLSWTAGLGATIHTVYLGEDYEQVENATQGGIILGTTDYSPGQLESEKVYYWRVDEGFGSDTYKGDVWTFTTPGAVGNPQPANGAADLSMATTLSWTAASNAASHQVYLGMDKEAVRSADTSSPEYEGSKALGAESYDPGFLEADTTYYWRVDEVSNGNLIKGPIWTFTIGNYLVVDDFESYTDDDAAGQAIWQSWIDGFGVADNGAQVGYLLPPYCERMIVHSGAQSMPLLYTNENGVTNSEATLILTAPRDWTTEGVGELSLWFRGSTSNAAEPLYVAVANSAGAPAIVANDDLNAAKAAVWTQWVVPLQAFADRGINLSNVDQLAVGLGAKSGVATPGGTGTIYIDDIRLYRP